MKSISLWKGIMVLASIGIVLAVYLLWQQFFHPAFQPCSITQTVNCNAIISGPVAKTLGIPTPLYGLIGYIVIFFSALLRKRKVLLFTATFGLLFCLWIGYREIFQLHVVCPVCIICQIVMIGVFLLALRANQKHLSS